MSDEILTAFLGAIIRIGKRLLRVRPKCLLVVDDVAADRELVRETVTQCGYSCDTVESGEVALAKIRYKRYSVVLSDYHLAGMDGAALARKVKDEFPRLRFFMVVSTPDSLSYLRPGDFLDGVVVKPVTHDAVRRIMGKKVER